MIFPAVLVPLIISCVNIPRDKIPTFPVKGSSFFYRDLWYLVKFTIQDMKSIAKEAGCESTGSVSVQSSSASSLMSPKSPVPHSLWQKLNSAFPKITLVFDIQLETPWVWVSQVANMHSRRSCPQQTSAPEHQEQLPSTWDTHTEWHFHLRSWTFCGPNSSFFRNAFPLLKEIKCLLKHVCRSAFSFNLAASHFCTSVKQPPPYACCLSSYSVNATIKHN